MYFGEVRATKLFLPLNHNGFCVNRTLAEIILRFLRYFFHIQYDGGKLPEGPINVNVDMYDRMDLSLPSY